MEDRQTNNDRSQGPGGSFSRFWHKRRRAKRVARSIGRDYRQVEGKTTILKLAALLTFFVLGVLTVGGVAYANYAKDLPSPQAMASRKVFQSVRILDRNGLLLYEAFDPETGRRTSVSLDGISQNMIIATLSAEDAGFFDNPGFDIKGVVRAALLNLSAGEIVSGGSTITQQVARNALIDDKERQQRTISRKIKEVILAYQIGQEFSKDQILETYLNDVYYGNMSYGVEAAAYTYFGKHARDLTLAEAAYLAGFVSAPSDYDPYIHPDAAKVRQNHVIDMMEKHLFVTQEEGEQARKEQVQFADPRVNLLAPHFVMFVREELEKKYGKEFVYTSGLVVTTTLDYRLQELAEDKVKTHVQAFRAYGASNGAMISLNPNTGEILAMVGSADYYEDRIDGNVNVVTSLRSPGSSIKPVFYLAAFTRGYTPASVVIDSPASFPMGSTTYTPRNYDGSFRGAVSIRKALAGSLNLPIIKIVSAIGVPAAIEQAKRMGINTFKPSVFFGLPVAVGGVEVKMIEEAGAYAVFAAQGVRHDPTPFITIADGRGNIIHRLNPTGLQIVDPKHAYMITDILSDNNARSYVFGAQSPLVLSRPAAAKTGTAERVTDLWTFGYTPDLVTGVWVGNSDGRPMAQNAYGSITAGKIWHDFMEEAHQGLPVKQFSPPPGYPGYPDSTPAPKAPSGPSAGVD